MKKRKVTLYVKSIKTATGTEETSYWGYVGAPGVKGGYRLLRDYKVISEAKYEFVLLVDQQKVVEMVKKIALNHGFEVEVVDVTKENILHKIVKKGPKS